MKKIRAKFKCVEKTEYVGGKALKFTPVTSGSEENESFYQHTPSGELTISIVKKETADTFEVGKEYYIDFTPADVAEDSAE